MGPSVQIQGMEEGHRGLYKVTESGNLRDSYPSIYNQVLTPHF